MQSAIGAALAWGTALTAAWTICFYWFLEPIVRSNRQTPWMHVYACLIVPFELMLVTPIAHHIGPPLAQRSVIRRYLLPTFGTLYLILIWSPVYWCEASELPWIERLAKWIMYDKS